MPLLPQKYLYILLLLFAFSLPLSLKAAEVLLIIIALYWLASADISAAFQQMFAVPRLFFMRESSLQERIVNGFRLLPIIFAGFFAIHLLAVLYTEDITSAWHELSIKFSFLVFPFVLFSAPELSRKQIRQILFSFAAACLITGLICFIGSLINYYNIRAVSYLHYTWLSRIMNFHPAYLCLYMSFTFFILVVLLHEGWKSYNRIIRIAGILSLLFTGYIIIMLAARLVVVTFLVLVMSGFLLWMAKKKRLLLGLLVTILAFSTLYVAVSSFFVTKTRAFKVFRSSNRGDYQHTFFIDINDPRGQIWESCAKPLALLPIWGYGIGNDVETILLEIYKKKPYPNLVKIKANAHNQYLQTFLATGVLGLFFLLAMLLFPLYLSWKGKLYLYTLFLLLMAIPMLTETMLEVPRGVLFFAFFSCLLARAYALRSETAALREARPPFGLRDEDEM